MTEPNGGSTTTDPAPGSGGSGRWSAAPTEAADGTAPPAPPVLSAWSAGAVGEYVDENIDRFTADTLRKTLAAAGHDPETIAAGIRLAVARRAAKPRKRQARLLVMGSYVLTYVVLAGGLIGVQLPYGASPIALVILTITMTLALAVALWSLRRRSAPIGLLSLFAFPLVLLAVVGGACYATTGTPVTYLRDVLHVVPS